MTLLKTFAPNTLGRDFVIGDLHGRLDLFNLALAHVGFDPKLDRVFSVGDLVDRGRDSFGCLKLLSEPWFHACKGNHEDLTVLGLSNPPLHGQLWRMNGGGWDLGLLPQERAELQELVKRAEDLPLVITVEGLFHMVHAELLPHGMEVTDEDLSDPVELEQICGTKLSLSAGGCGALWNRDVFRELFAEKITPQRKQWFLEDSLDLVNKFKTQLPIFSGHTVMQEPTQAGMLINIDTGAVFSSRYSWAGLTICQPKTGEFWKVREDKIERAEKVVLAWKKAQKSEKSVKNVKRNAVNFDEISGHKISKRGFLEAVAALAATPVFAHVPSPIGADWILLSRPEPNWPTSSFTLETWTYPRTGQLTATSIIILD